MTDKTLPLVSIGIPTYNSASRIHKSLNSIFQQMYSNLEVIVCDNCSTDSLPEVIEALQKDHPEIKYFRQPVNQGMVRNFRSGLEIAQGKYFMWVSDDDQLEPNVISRYVDFLEGHADYSVVSGALQFWKDGNRVFVEKGFSFEQKSAGLRSAKYYFKVIYGGMIHGLMRRALTTGIELRNNIGNDYHFIANMAYRGKLMNFDFIGYHKMLGGTSRNFKNYAKALGEKPWVGHFPHVKIACDAYDEVMHRSVAYSGMRFIPKVGLAVLSFTGVMYCQYVKIRIGDRVRKYVAYPIRRWLKITER